MSTNEIVTEITHLSSTIFTEMLFTYCYKILDFMMDDLFFIKEELTRIRIYNILYTIDYFSKL